MLIHRLLPFPIPDIPPNDVRTLHIWNTDYRCNHYRWQPQWEHLCITLLSTRIGTWSSHTASVRTVSHSTPSNPDLYRCRKTHSSIGGTCGAAIHHQGLSDADLAGGYQCDPMTKSDLKIIAKKGLLLRPRRNFDKIRVSAHGAYYVVE